MFLFIKTELFQRYSVFLFHVFGIVGALRLTQRLKTEILLKVEIFAFINKAFGVFVENELI